MREKPEGDSRWRSDGYGKVMELENEREQSVVWKEVMFFNGINEGEISGKGRVRGGTGGGQGRRVRAREVEGSPPSEQIGTIFCQNNHFRTKLVLHTRDSEGDPFLVLSQGMFSFSFSMMKFLSLNVILFSLFSKGPQMYTYSRAALALLESVKLDVIIIAEISAGVKILAGIGSRAKIPIIVLFAAAPSLSFSERTYLIRIGEDESSQAKGIATVVQAFNWRSVILIYEDNDSTREILPNLITYFEETDARIALHISLLTSSTDREIIEQLKMLMNLQTNVYVVHMSPILASRLFSNAKRLGMISRGYAWITTGMITNFMNSMDPSVIESMQGMVGFKPYIPASKELRRFEIRWSKHLNENQNMQEMELNVYGIWAYDIVQALAKAAERVTTRHPHNVHQETRLNTNFTTVLLPQGGLVIMDEMLRSRFQGISGGFQLTDGWMIQNEFEIVNVFRGERLIGYWNPENGITSIMKEENHTETNLASSSKLESVIWPGGTKDIPKGLSLHRKRLRIVVPVKIGFRELISVVPDPQTNETTVTGFCAEVFKEAIKSLNYDLHYDFVPFVNVSGGMAGNYDDLILGVYHKNFDAVVGDITIIASRFPFVDFTLPFTDMGMGVVVPKTNKNDIWIFLKPLSGDLWITTGAFFIFTGIVVWLIEHRINDEFQGSPSEQIGTIFWFSFSTLVFAHQEKLLSNLSKFVVTVWVFAVLIITSSYTATLASMLTVQQIQFSSGDRELGSSADLLLLRGINKSTIGNPKVKTYHSPEEYADALRRGSKNGGVSAIIDEIPYLKIFLAKYPSDYTMIKSKATTGGFGFVFPKGSPLVQDISSAIMRLREEEKLQMMENEWFNGTKSIFINQDSASDTSRLSLLSFGGLFLITAISSISALFLCFFQRRKSISVGNLKACLNSGILSVQGFFKSSICKIMGRQKE
ncbi:hypothetical protein V6N13_083871 [Hibiscus sabdariffa]